MTPTPPTDRVRNLLAFLLVGAFISTLPLFIYKDIPTDNKDIITYMVGQLSGMALMALGFFFTNKAGQDAADADKTANTAKALDAITATAKAAGTSDSQPDVVLKPGETAQAEQES